MLLYSADGDEIDRLIGFDNNRDAWFEILQAYTAGKHTLADLLNRIQADTADAELNRQVADKYFNRGTTVSAHEYYLRAVRHASGDLLQYVRYKAAVCDLTIDQNPGPLRLFIDMTTDDNLRYSGQRAFIRYHANRNEFDEAVRIHEAILQKFPSDAGKMNDFAWFVFQNKLEHHYKRAIEVATQAVSVAPEQDHIWDTLGQLCFANGQVREAIDAMQRAAELAPGEVSYRNLLTRYRQAAF